jgi:hypothetical protein
MRELKNVAEGLRHCIHSSNNGCDNCPYYGSSTKEISCDSYLMLDALAFIEDKFEKDMNKMRIENSELIQQNLKLEKDLARERAYNYAIVTVIRNNYPTGGG